MAARVGGDYESDWEDRRKERESVIELGKINKLINKKCAYTSGIPFSTYWAILDQTYPSSAVAKFIPAHPYYNTKSSNL